MKILAPLLVIVFSLGIEAMAAPATPTPTATVSSSPTPTPKPKKPGFFERLFGRLPTPTPIPDFTPTPSPTPGKKKRVKAAVTPTPLPTASITPVPTPTPVRKKHPKAAVTPTPEPSVSETPVPSPTPARKKRIRAQITPTPDADSTPAITPAASAGSTPLPNSLPPLDEGKKEPEPVAGETPQPAATTDTPVPTDTPPISDAVRSSPLNQPIPIIGEVAATPSALQITPPPAIAESEQQALDQASYEKLKAKALTDEKLQDLQTKADTAASIGERYQALKTYYPALFAKMRKIDSSQSDLIDRMEAASQRRLERMLADHPDMKPGN